MVILYCCIICIMDAMAYSTCISRHGLVISMKIIIIRTYLHMIYQKYE